MDADLKKMITETEWEIFPLNKPLPKHTVLSIFQEHYNREESKTTLTRNTPKSKRLREGFWSLFACIALDHVEQREHWILFPKDVRNDVSFLSKTDFDTERQKFNYFEHDVKEYTSFSTNLGFKHFLKTTVTPGRRIYGVIVGVQADIGEFKSDSLFLDEADRGVFIIGADIKNEDSFKGRVIYIVGNKILFDDVIDLSDRIDPAQAKIVFHAKFRNLP